ncbi:ubiquitin carboxyl-terminal hydrolase [Colletotrichum orchidophilum]|uniref:Ubiquitin carboxyl-terminal hydrolase n=1 Tax=Colletotrichum orchidophilum TaxID=1209926 RepID=A0A1G4BMB8_9PEZI|nr:ubiquitin carboxyl-terminal hydrolase [Colletotrichum orchidophilum]OHF02610.1 ubiquitin carboxyl-terminal hydrolase [Colletotrichum orchidophilum]
MDLPTGSSEAPERAVSSEPSSTRPNPFTDGDGSSRKRRRTSMSGGSRSLSVDSTKSRLDTSSSPSAKHPDETATQDSAMKIDTHPSTPQTPERQSTAREPPTEPSSSRVTINLRNIAPPDPLSSSPVSPTPRTLPDQPTGPSEGVKKSVEELDEVDMAQAPIEITDTPPSSSSSPQSPEVEVVAITDDDQDAPYDEDVSIIREDATSFDPTPEFPYHEAHESLPETVAKLVNYLSSQAPPDEAVLESLCAWMVSYVKYVGVVGGRVAYESQVAYYTFWHMFPEIAWALSTRKHPIPLESRQTIGQFFHAYSMLTAHFVEFDFLTAQAFQTSPGDERRQPEFLLFRYLQPLTSFAKREHGRTQNGQIPDEELLSTDMLNTFQAGIGGIKGLIKLAQMHLSNTAKYQHLMDVLAPICGVAAHILQKVVQGIHPEASPQSLEAAKVRVADGHLLYNLASSALSTTIENKVTQLSNDTTSGLVQSLSELLKICLSGEHRLATERLKAYQQKHPELPPKFIPEAISLEWRLGIYGKLITSSQMQLRVLAASNMCHDLVTCWKRYNDNEDEECKQFLNYVAEYLLRTRLVDYILGPTCHPEITVESGNIVGFLVVTRLYRSEQTDLLWQTITTTQDPRVSEALIRMTTGIANLFHKEELHYLCEKLRTLPIENFTPSVRGLCDQSLKALQNKSQFAGESQSVLPLSICIRLLRESSIYVSDSVVAHPDVHHFAMNKFRELVRDGIEPEVRKEIYLDCIKDITAKTPTTLGTLSCLSMALRPPVASELRTLTTEHNLTSLLVDELGHAIEQGKQNGIRKILGGVINYPRRDLIANILAHEPSTVTSDLGPRLWDMLVGHGAASQDDRDDGWKILNSVPKTAFGNPFLSVCFSDYLPNLPRDCFCGGALEFVRNAVLPRVNDINDIILDDVESLAQSGVEQLWRMILDAEDGVMVAKDMAFVDAAIQTLVSDIYVDSLVNRCLEQMLDAAKRLEAFDGSKPSDDDESMAIISTEKQTQEQERTFSRSLAVLRHFMKAHQAKAHFSAPDLRALTPGSPSIAEGESAELKVQSFDGDKQTDIVPLEVGRQNTAASLLASIRQATGFDNYRIYYRGRPFAPNENDVCRSLEDLKIHDGLMLVKREETGIAMASRIKPGASLLEIEILGHFEQLWDYLSMTEAIATEMHTFLTGLPADTHMLATFDSPDTSYRQVFPSGQPFKSLYALYAMTEYIGSAVRKLNEDTMVITDAVDSDIDAYLDALVRVRALIVAAISDRGILGDCASEALQNRLTYNLMNVYGLTFRDPEVDELDVRPKPVAMAPADRLVEILRSAVSTPSHKAKVSLIASTFSAILRSAAVDSAFWASLKALPNLEELMGILLLDEPSDAIRTNIAKLLEERVITPCEYVSHNEEFLPRSDTIDRSNMNTHSFCAFLWPMLHRLIPRAAKSPKQCQQVFELSLALLREMAFDEAAVVDMPVLARDCGRLLLEHDSSEVGNSASFYMNQFADHFKQFGQAGIEDAVANGLVKLFQSCLDERSDVDLESGLPANLGRKLFWKHLFPPPRQHGLSSSRCSLLSTDTRRILAEIIFDLVREQDREFHALLEDLESLVPFDEFDNGLSTHPFTTEARDLCGRTDPYLYELQPSFDRMSAVRAPCGYAGLRNLSNTCYLNSLFTQLFMNTGFRQFMMNARVPGQASTHGLLRETRKLFAFMQESSRKFIDPSLLVGSIKTYEETVIDVHNQMDVDEFYNLLFDRWEGQLSTAEDRKALRSFYGGQLVQQVASKECEHISERLEPFSAIQCDIKGKSTLQDSLQAYVDGEIMEGDNKYKCSSCDRHVDAVKRACLKDIPDNLIFHLKRFDFNLRTLMRSKINDHFSFPTKIDMRPYTIDHLGSPSDSGEEDIFELVGVLVHAGTAESGHYYSYIRERPTMATSEAWFEFNDDLVSPWDPAKMEESTFGGTDGSVDTGLAYDKTYSAYMLFYQRSSVLKAEQEKLQSQSVPTPLKVEVPPEVADHIIGENTVLLRRHCLYDPSHSKFVLRMFQHAMVRNGGNCSDAHIVEQRAMHMFLGHLDQVVSRTKDLPDFEEYRDEIEHAVVNCAKCAMDFFDYFQERHEAFRQLLQRNPDCAIRYSIGSLFITALRQIKISKPEVWGLSQDDLVEDPVIMQCVQLLEALWNNFHANIRSWPEVFQTILAFAQMGPLETAVLMAETWFYRVLRIVIADANMDLPNNYARMLTNVIRRISNTRSTSYEMIIQLIDHFMDALEDVIDVHTIVESAEMRLDIYMEHQAPKMCWTPDEINVLTHEWKYDAGSTFVKKLIDIDQEPACTASIIKRIIHLNHEMDDKVFILLKNTITGGVVQYSNTPYIRAAAVFSDESRNTANVQTLFRSIAFQCRALQNTDGKAFLDFFRLAFISLQNETEEIRAMRYPQYVETIPTWAPPLLGYYDADVRQGTEGLLYMWFENHELVEDEDEGLAISVNATVRKLAMNCLLYLQEYFVKRRAQVAKHSTEHLQAIIAKCEPFFGVDLGLDNDRLITYGEFQNLYHSVVEPLRRMTVEELEDEGSDWENSCVSSEQLESIADINMQAAGDLPESALQ